MAHQGSASFQDEAKRIAHAFLGASFGWLVISSQTHLLPVILLGGLFIVILVGALVAVHVSEKLGNITVYLIAFLSIYVLLIGLIVYTAVGDPKIVEISGTVTAPDDSEASVALGFFSIKNVVLAVLLTYTGYISTILFPAPAEIQIVRKTDKE